MLLELLSFTLVGLVVGGAAALFLPQLFLAPRTVTVLTGVGAALLTGGLGHAILGGGHLLATTALSAVGSGLLVSLLARPDQKSPRSRGAHRRPHHA